MKSLQSHHSLFAIACAIGDTQAVCNLIKQANFEKNIPMLANDFIAMVQENCLNTTAIQTLSYVFYSEQTSKQFFCFAWPMLFTANQQQQTALHIAAQQNKLDILKLFFPLEALFSDEYYFEKENGKSNGSALLNFINVKDHENKQALDRALENNNKEFARILGQIKKLLMQLYLLQSKNYWSCNGYCDELLQAQQRITDLTKNNGSLSILL